ncbi:MAG: ferrous iron transport protein B [Candidatus Hadarchaeum sp.]|uniref:ferrous iron transport protein B n=1 Tax=Candidatus Hadarchaeum sp. TaxID=2883567 RepID=UPI003D0A1156
MPETKKPEIVVALAGTPNVGKSAIFHQITGADVIISNYPGTTVELMEGRVKRGEHDIRVIDLPGVYSLGAVSQDELVARRAILEQEPDVIMNIADASNLERSLFLTLQLMELGRPMLLVLNMYDVALAKGLHPSTEKLAKKLGLPVITTVATHGENVARAFDEAIKIALEGKRPKRVLPLSRDTEKAIRELAVEIAKFRGKAPFNLSARTLALKLLEGDEHLIRAVADLPGSESFLMKARKLAREMAVEYGEPSAYRIARERHGIAAMISKEVTDIVPVKPKWTYRLDDITSNMRTGVPIMLAVFAALILLLIYVGGFLEGLVVGAWDAYVSPVLSGFFTSLGNLGRVLDIGINQGISGILAVVIPYILVFFLILALLEDVGYLPRMAFVMDSAMHRIGLHGRAVVPMLGGFGCNVPAIMSTRVLTTRRERLIANFLITMVPCSARTAVILGTVGYFLGVQYALLIYGIILVLIFIVGLLLNRFLRGKVSGMIMEVPPLRVPMLRPLLSKTWMRMKHFVYFATPILILGSLAIGALDVSGLLSVIVSPLSPLTSGWLGLPAVTIISLLYGFIRKEGALVLLVALAGTSNLLEFMTPLQLFVFALVVSIYVPCAATVAALKQELGWKDAILITIGTFVLALLVGGIFNHLNPLGI